MLIFAWLYLVYWRDRNFSNFFVGTGTARHTSNLRAEARHGTARHKISVVFSSAPARHGTPQIACRGTARHKFKRLILNVTYFVLFSALRRVCNVRIYDYVNFINKTEIARNKIIGSRLKIYINIISGRSYCRVSCWTFSEKLGRPGREINTGHDNFSGD